MSSTLIHGGVKNGIWGVPPSSLALWDPWIHLQKVLDSYYFIYFFRQNMVSDRWAEFIIPPLSAILTLAWDLKQFNIDENYYFIIFCKLKPLSGIPNHFHPLSDPE